jgi:hypothetical protein
MTLHATHCAQDAHISSMMAAMPATSLRQRCAPKLRSSAQGRRMLMAPTLRAAQRCLLNLTTKT